MDPDYKAYFRGKRITMLGLGLLGRGVNVAKFLAENSAILTITDLKSKKELAPSLKKLAKYPDIHFHLGGHRMSDFQKADMVIKAAGTALDSPYTKEARKNKIPIEMDASLFVKFAPKGVVVVGITGTRGKSTTTHLIHHILQRSCLCRKGLAFAGGNVRGVATLPLLKKVKARDIVILELDSWQLQGFGESKISPHIAVFTTFLPDHLNYYKGNMNKYFADKANIFKHQNSKDILVMGEQADKEIKKRFRGKINGKKTIAKMKDLPKSWHLKIPGKHNRYNAAIAAAVCRTLGVSDKDIKKGMESFSAVPGRLELVRTFMGVEYYNDTTATTPDASIAALKALAGKAKNVVLIAGGNDKDLEYKEMGRRINKTVKALILIQGSATEKILHALPKTASFPIDTVDAMNKAVRTAYKRAKKGDIVLLSPGAASFGIFKNEFDRGEQFVKCVKKLK